MHTKNHHQPSPPQHDRDAEFALLFELLERPMSDTLVLSAFESLTSRISSSRFRRSVGVGR